MIVVESLCHCLHNFCKFKAFKVYHVQTKEMSLTAISYFIICTEWHTVPARVYSRAAFVLPSAHEASFWIRSERIRSMTRLSPPNHVTLALLLPTYMSLSCQKLKVCPRCVVCGEGSEEIFTIAALYLQTVLCYPSLIQAYSLLESWTRKHLQVYWGVSVVIVPVNTFFNAKYSGVEGNAKCLSGVCVCVTPNAAGGTHTLNAGVVRREREMLYWRSFNPFLHGQNSQLLRSLHSLP